MSLEAAIQENTAVMRELIARLTNSPTTAAAPQVANDPKPQAATTADTARTAAEAKADAPASKVESSGQHSPVVTYDDVKRAILELSKKKGRDAAVKVLSEFGVASGPELQKTPEKFGAFVESAKVALEA